MFNSLIHFKLLFLNGIKQCCNFILLMVTIQFFYHYSRRCFDLFLHQTYEAGIRDKRCRWQYRNCKIRGNEGKQDHFENRIPFGSSYRSCRCIQGWKRGSSFNRDHGWRWLDGYYRCVAFTAQHGNDLPCFLSYQRSSVVNSKENQPWIFTGRTDAEAEAEAPIPWPSDVKSWFIGKDPDAGIDWRQKEKGVVEDEMVR